MISSIATTIKVYWYHLRHKEYFYSKQVSPSGGDDTANIQAAIDAAAGLEPQWFKEVRQEYESKWYRFFIRKPVLKRRVRLSAGAFTVKDSLKMRQSVHVAGKGIGKTVLKKA